MNSRWLVATAAMSAVTFVVATAPASASAPATYSQIMRNATVIRTVPTDPVTTGGSTSDASLVNSAYSQFTGLSTANARALSPYQSSSSAAGISNVMSGSLNAGFSDVPLDVAEFDTASPSAYAQVPVALDAVTIIYNVNFTTSDTVTNSFGSVTTNGLRCAALEASHHIALNGVTLGGIFSGNITSWTNSTIVLQNPKLVVRVKVPVAAAIAASGKKGRPGYVAPKAQRDKKVSVSCLSSALMTQPSITVESLGNGAGTTFTLRDYLSKVDPIDFPTSTASSFASATATYADASTLAPAVASRDGAIGYVEQRYAVLNHLVAMRVKNGAGLVVAPSQRSITAAAIHGLAAIAANSNCPGSGFNLTPSAAQESAASWNNSSSPAVDSECYSLNDVDNAAAYPIVGLSYAIVTRAQSSDATALTVAKFLEFLTQSGKGDSPRSSFGQNLAAAQSYVALPKILQAVAFNAIKSITLANGTTSAVSATL